MPLAKDIIQQEEKSLAFYDSRGELKKKTYHGVDIIHYSPLGKDNYFYKSKLTKSKILLHYTAGYLWGDLATLTSDDLHVSVPFVVARSGKILSLFDPDYWSYHLGRTAVGGNKYNSSRSVAIEMSNLGRLERSGNWLFNSSGSKYCRPPETQYYIDLGKKYRGYQYYATFTDAQYQSLGKLLDVLTIQYNIPPRFLPEKDRYNMFATAKTARNFTGICSHVNFRTPTAKQDIGPAFDWAAIGG